MRAPPTFEIRKIKKTQWNPVIRYLFIRIQGRTSSMDAPVVPIMLAITDPIIRKITFLKGVASPETLM